MILTSAALSLSIAVSVGWLPTGQRWESLPVSYCITGNAQNTSLSSDQQVAAIERAIQYWVSSSAGGSMSCTSFAATRASYSCSAGSNSQDHENNISFVRSGWEYGSSTLGVTLSLTSGARCGQVQDDTGATKVLGCLADADIVINDRDYTWRTDGQDTDLISVVAHEFGHFLGLDHCNDNNTCGYGEAIMYASYAGANMRMPRADDTEGVCALYPGASTSGFGAPCSGNSACTSGVCASDGYCSQSCGSCPDNYRCGNDSGHSSICLKADQGGQGVCEVCTNASSCADGGTCVGGLPEANSGRCLQPCGANNSCGANFTCVVIDLGNNQTGNYCAPQSMDCTDVTASGDPGLGQSCTGSCATGLSCLGSNGAATGICSQACGSGCPSGYGCTTTQVGDYCFPTVAEGASCGLYDLCDGGNGRCLIPAEGASPVCYRSCANNGSCGSNQTCETTTLTDNSQVQICTPPAAMSDRTGCSCNTGSGCQSGCSCDSDCWSAGSCSCDTTAACDANCSCDPNCSQDRCDCDASDLAPEGLQALKAQLGEDPAGLFIPTGLGAEQLAPDDDVRGLDLLLQTELAHGGRLRSAGEGEGEGCEPQGQHPWHGGTVDGATVPYHRRSSL